MRCTLLGTGAADGWPNPFCTCSSCEDARRRGEVRGQTAALVDGVLLLDCGPEAPRAAVRLGHRLADVRHVLLTHAHPDHVGPAALMWRGWAGRGEPLDLVGPPSAVDVCRQWIGPEDPVRVRTVGAGDRFTLGEPDGYDVRVLRAAHTADGVLYDLTGHGGRLLYATDTGPLPEETVAAVAGAGFDLVLLEETFGRRADHGTEHLDLDTFGEQVHRLREVGAVTSTTQLVAVHLGHHNPPAPELSRALGAFGARAVPDGTTLATGTCAPRTAGRRTLVLGAARSGKSAHAERLLAAEPAVTYVATGGKRADDAEWRTRVEAHRRRRPAGWHTVETTDLPRALREARTPLLVDCLTLWLTAVMDEEGAWEGSGDSADERVSARVDRLVQAWRSVSVPVVAVTNEVGAGVVPASAAGRRFRDALGALNARMAAESDEVLLVVAGRVLAL